MSEEWRTSIGVVAIGRNEGERLKRCLRSALRDVSAMVYVDSGSTDGSVEAARALGADVVMLDLSEPFTAARSRNAGIARLRELHPEIQFVQVVDGDCELREGWIEAAWQHMMAHPRVAVVCGRRRERHPQASVYNRLCDMEWDTPIGEAEACGGDALIRLEALEQIGGYDATLIAGEEPEMCYRLRQAGWLVHRIDREMTLHDANMMRFSQSWRRAVRAGHAYAECRALHAGKPGAFCAHAVRSIIEWGLLLPLVALSLAWMTWGLSLLLLGGYIWLWYRVRSHRLRHGDSPEDAGLYASHCIIGKFAGMVGMAMYWWNRLRGRRTRLIEYKGPEEHHATPAAELVADTAPSPDASRPLRLAYLTTAYPKVSHTFIRREILELERRGHMILRLAIRDGGDAVDAGDLAEARRTIHCLSQPRLQLIAATLGAVLLHPVRWLQALRTTIAMHRRSERGLIVHLAYLVEAAFFLRMLRKHHVEHVHVHFGTNCAAVARLIRILGGPPFSIAIHGPDEFDAPYGLSLREKIEEAAFVTAISNYCSAQLRRWVSYQHWSKIHIVRCTVADEFFASHQPIDPHSNTLVCVGRLTAQKGQHLLIDALDALRTSGLAANLILAGDGEMRSELEAYIRARRLEHYISITGWIDERTVRALVLKSRAVVQPSFAEGLPVVIMEALALGRPVISTAIAAIPELVRNGHTGWLILPGDVDELTAAMRAALTAPVDELHRMGSIGRHLVRQRHAAGSEVDRLESLLLQYARPLRSMSALAASASASGPAHLLPTGDAAVESPRPRRMATSRPAHLHEPAVQQQGT